MSSTDTEARKGVRMFKKISASLSLKKIAHEQPLLIDNTAHLRGRKCLKTGFTVSQQTLSQRSGYTIHNIFMSNFRIREIPGYSS
jgi:hypothetical protein